MKDQYSSNAWISTYWKEEDTDTTVRIGIVEEKHTLAWLADFLHGGEGINRDSVFL